MHLAWGKLFTLITTTNLESRVAADLDSHGVAHWTTTDVGNASIARGDSRLGTRAVRFEAVMSQATAFRLAAHLRTRYPRGSGVVAYVSDIGTIDSQLLVSEIEHDRDHDSQKVLLSLVGAG